MIGLTLFGLVLISILENSTHAPSNYDTGLYHAQAIRWIETFPAVPGLGNLHTRFAFNSSWLVLNALFSLSFLGTRSFHLVPAALTVIVAIDFASGALDWYRGKPTFANILRTILLPMIFFVLGSEISSPGTDLPVILLLWFLMTAWLDSRNVGINSNQVNRLIIFIAAITLLTIKLSAAPLLLVAAWIWLKNIRKPGYWYRLILLGVILLLPWLVRNVIISGYLVYPLPGIDLFPVDWKIPLDVAREEVEIIQAFARDSSLPTEIVLAEPFSTWLHNWFSILTANQKWIVLAAAFSPIAFTVGLFAIQKYRKNHKQKIGSLVSIFVIIYIGGIYWLLSAPVIRFGYGFLIGLICMAVVPWLLLIERYSGILGKWLHLGVILALIAYQAAFLYQSFEPDGFQTRILFPADYPQLPSESCSLKNSQVWCPSEVSWYSCWYEPFPCIPRPNDTISQRGPDLRSGFLP